MSHEELHTAIARLLSLPSDSQKVQDIAEWVQRALPRLGEAWERGQGMRNGWYGDVILTIEAGVVTEVPIVDRGPRLTRGKVG